MNVRNTALKIRTGARHPVPGQKSVKIYIIYKIKILCLPH
ncbi:hypothetical protein D1AOALGA4SA_5950 [Olavius algarvensis Delta 1 endosymbiont]|nr:hypothetical protein D1AOALGA4SA_5950 [Olavius algarvensis Delta 1 endosymbiont]